MKSEPTKQLAIPFFLFVVVIVFFLSLNLVSPVTYQSISNSFMEGIESAFVVGPVQGATFTFSETGLPSGMTWEVSMIGNIYSASAPNQISITIAISQSSSFTVPTLTSSSGCVKTTYTPSPSSGTASSSNSITYSSSTSYNLALSINGNTGVNSSVNYGTSSQFNASCDGYFVALYMNGAELTPYSENSSSYSSILGAGLYKITAVSNDSKISNVTYWETVNKATPSLTLTPPSSNNYTGSAFNTGFSVSTLNNQITTNLYINGIRKASTISSNSFNEYSANTYNLVENTSGNQNYTSASTSGSFIISQATPTLTLTASKANFTYDGTPENFTYGITTVGNQLTATLASSGTSLGSISTSSNYYARASAGTYDINISTAGNQNYTTFSKRLVRSISRATVSQTLKAFPSSKFNYSGSSPTLQDTFNTTLVPGNTFNLGFILNNGSSTAGIVYTGYSQFNDTPSKIYSSAGIYPYSFAAVSNANYTILASQTVNVNISKALPRMTLSSVPSANFTSNGTYLVYLSNITTYKNQLLASLYINGTKEATTNTTSLYNVSDLQGVYSAVFNTSGNKNYSSLSISLSKEIYVPLSSAVLNLYLNGAHNSNSTITYGASSEFTANVSSGGEYIGMYINGVKTVNLTSRNVSYPAGVLSAGNYSITVFTNTSGISNVTYWERIKKAQPVMHLYVSPGSFVYDGAPDIFTANISTLGSQLSALLNVSGGYRQTNSETFYEVAAAGDYIAIFNTSGNQNYTSRSLTTSVKISKAVLYQTLKAFPSSAFTYDGTTPTIQDTLTPENVRLWDRIPLMLYSNNVYTGINETVPVSMTFNFSELPAKYASLGNYSYYVGETKTQNYTIYESPSLSVDILPLRVKSNLSNSSTNNVTILFTKISNKTVIINLTKVVSSSIISIPTTISEAPLKSITISINRSAPSSSINVSGLSNESCFGGLPGNSIYNFTVGSKLDYNNTLNNVVYNFNVKNKFLAAHNAVFSSVTLYKCNTSQARYVPMNSSTSNYNLTDRSYSYLSSGFSTYYLGYSKYSIPTVVFEESGLPQDMIWSLDYDGNELYNYTNNTITFPLQNYTTDYNVYPVNITSYVNSEKCIITYSPNPSNGKVYPSNTSQYIYVNFIKSTLCTSETSTIPSSPTILSFIASNSIYIELGILAIVIFAGWMGVRRMRRVRKSPHRKTYKKRTRKRTR